MSTAPQNTIDRARAYGDGLFETIAIRRGRPRFWHAHLERLQTGCERLGLPCPNVSELERALAAALQNSTADTEFATCRLVVAAADSKRGYRRADGAPAKVELTVYPATQLPRDCYAKGVAVRSCNLRLATQPALAGIKSLNRLEQVLARAEWRDPDVFEGLLCDTDGRLICGTMSNVFVALGSALITPAITRCGVAGVMRAEILRMLDSAGIQCTVRDVDFGELARASECFLTNSQFGVVPVRRIDAADRAVGPLSRQVQALAGAGGVPECLP